jgi:hypothetical protein
VRFVIGSFAFVVGCSATSPAPLPPPRYFPPNAVAAEETAARPIAKETPKPVEPPTERQRYWHWIALADLVTVPLTATWFTRSSIAWGIPVVIGSPTVHFIHGNTTMGAISLPLRAAAYGAAYAVIRSEECEHRNFCLPLGALLTLELAVVLTTTLDLVFGYTDEPIKAWKKLPVIPSVASNGRDTLLTFSLSL